MQLAHKGASLMSRLILFRYPAVSIASDHFSQGISVEEL